MGGNQAQSATVPLVLLPMGDSNTWGTGNPDCSADPAYTVGYRQALQRALSDAGLASTYVGSFRVGYEVMRDCAVEGWPGKGVNTMIWRVREGILERFEPDFCLLLIGANNLWRSLDDRHPITPFGALFWVWRLQRLLGEMRRRSPKTHILVGKPVTPGNAPVPLVLYRFGISALAALYRLTGGRILAVDLRADNDGVHYTPAGHERVAALWCEAIVRCLHDTADA